MLLTVGGYGNCLVLATSGEEATELFDAYLTRHHWQLKAIEVCQETDPTRAIGYPHLERLAALAYRYGIGVEIVPAAFASDPGQAN